MTKEVIMNKLIIILLAASAVIGGVYLSRSSTNPEINSETNAPQKNFQKAPAFSLKDYNGNTVSLSDFAGKIVVVNAWASWCPFCVNELPAFAALQREFKDEIAVIAINRQESLATAKGYTDNAGITDSMIFLLDPNDSFYQSIGGFSMPETLFIDDEGNIRIHKRAPMELEEMREKVHTILRDS